MPDLSIFKLDDQTITIKDATARQAAESAMTLSTTASGNATTALNKINELESEKADTIISSTSGAIASFPDGAARPVDDLTVQIEPVQDLHGYDHPWPAGDGKNKLQITAKSGVFSGVTVTVNTDGTITLIGTANDYINIVLNANLALESGDWIYSGEGFGALTGSNGGVFASSETGTTTLSNAINNKRDGDFSFTGPVGKIWLYFNTGTVLNNTVKLMIRPATIADSSYAPYSNICPISGFDSVKVTRTGKNLLDDAYADTSSANFLWLYRNVGFPLKANQTYTFSVNRIAKSIRIVSVDESVVYAQLPSANKSLSYTPTSDILVVFMVWVNDGGILSGLNPQLELGSTATAYEPYQGETYEVEFPTEAGTVYGGTLDVTNGVLTVDRAQIASYAGETLPSTWISDRDVYSAGATPTTGAQVVYELAEPITYQLTAHEITTLLGQNNIWADTGDMSVTYRADTKLYIDNKFTELQALILENLEGETDHD